MPTHVRLVHHTLLDGRFHVYTSPDIKGLHVTADTMPDAQREAISVVDVIAEMNGWDKPVVSFSEEVVLQAAE